MISGLMSGIMDWLRDAFTANLALKIVSMVAALGLVAYTRGQLDETQRTVPVAVILRLPPDSANRELMTKVPGNIHVTVIGTTRAIDRLIQNPLPPVELDLRDGQMESVVFEKDMFSLPHDVDIKIIDPPGINLEWEDVVTRTIPVQSSRTGQPAKGYEVKDKLEVAPTQITVKGPESVVEVLQFARLAAFDVTGLTEGVYRRRIAIDDPPPLVEYLGPNSAMVTAVITRRQIEAKFQKLPVQVIGPVAARTIPRFVDVTVVGPPEVVSALRSDQVVPRVDLASAGIDPQEQRHGSATLKVRVELANAEAEVQPPTVAVKW